MMFAIADMSSLGVDYSLYHSISTDNLAEPPSSLLRFKGGYLSHVANTVMVSVVLSAGKVRLRQVCKVEVCHEIPRYA